MCRSLFFALLIAAAPSACAAGEQPDNDFVCGTIFRGHLVSHRPEACADICIYASEFNGYVTHILRIPVGALQPGVTSQPSSLALHKDRLFYDYHEQSYGGGPIPHIQEKIRQLSVPSLCAGHFEPVDADGRTPANGFLVDWLWRELGSDQEKRLKSRDERRTELFRDIVAQGDQVLLRFEVVYEPCHEGAARMTVYRLEREYDKRAKQWKSVAMKEVESFDAHFAEPFQAVVIEGTYFFITHSGKLYRAQPREGGLPRIDDLIYDKPQGRIHGLITDANSEKPGYFIFVRDEKGWYYVRLHKQIAPIRYEGKDPPKGQLPYETAFGFAQVLIDRKEVTIPPAR